MYHAALTHKVNSPSIVSGASRNRTLSVHGFGGQLHPFAIPHQKHLEGRGVKPPILRRHRVPGHASTFTLAPSKGYPSRLRESNSRLFLTKEVGHHDLIGKYLWFSRLLDIIKPPGQGSLPCSDPLPYTITMGATHSGAKIHKSPHRESNSALVYTKDVSCHYNMRAKIE